MPFFTRGTLHSHSKHTRTGHLLALIHWHRSPSIRTMAHTYLLRSNGRVVERPQYLYMRVAVAAHPDNIDLVLETYDALSRQVFTAASPVLFNAGTTIANFASCFLYTPDATSVSSILDSARELDKLWLADGGIGIYVGEIPAKR